VGIPCCCTFLPLLFLFAHLLSFAQLLETITCFLQSLRRRSVALRLLFEAQLFSAVFDALAFPTRYQWSFNYVKKMGLDTVTDVALNDKRKRS